MSINDTEADCSRCGTYNCQYLCTECVLELLLIAGIKEDEALRLLNNWDISLESYQVEQIKENINAKRT